MNAARQHELKASLQRELNRQAQERNLSSTGRIVWLVDQVENYVERWLGMRVAIPSTTLPLDDELFGMIEIGAKAVSAELQSLEAPAVGHSWRAFLAALAAVRVDNAPAPERLKKELVAVRSALTASATNAS